MPNFRNVSNTSGLKDLHLNQSVLQSLCLIVARMQKAERVRSASECQLVPHQEATRGRAGSRASLLEVGEGGEQALAGVDQVHDYR